MSITPPQTVVGAPRVPLPYGLFSVLAPREISESHWMGGGVQFAGLGTPPASGRIGPIECDADDTPGLPKSFQEGAPYSGASAFAVYGSYKCTPLGNPLSFAQQMASDRLAAWEERLVEEGLWEQLSNETLTELGALSPLDVIAAVESTLATEYGSLGVVHVGRATAVRLIEAGVVKEKNSRLFTSLGTPVIAGSGYGEGELYATPAIFGLRSEVFNSSNIEGDLLDREQNTLHAVAERFYLVGYDDSPVLHASIPAEPPTPAP